jgi:hypothetical protein
MKVPVPMPGREIEEEAPLYHSTVWRDVMHRIYRLEPRFELGTIDGQLISPVYRAKTLRSGAKSINAPFMFVPEPIGGIEKAEAVFVRMVEECRSKGDGFVEFKTFLPLDSNLLLDLTATKIDVATESVVSLAGGYEEVHAGYHKTLKRSLRKMPDKMSEAGIELVKSSTPRDLIQFYKVFSEVYRTKHQMVFHPLSLFETLFDEMKGRVELYVAKHEGNVVAGILVLLDGARATYAWGATDARYMSHRLAALLIDAAIQDACARGMDQMSLGYSSAEDENLLFFKKQWGSVERIVHAFYWGDYLPGPDLHTSYQTLRKIYSLVPASILRQLMPHLIPRLI